MSFFRRLRRPKEEPTSDSPEEGSEPIEEDQGIIWSDENRPTPVDEETLDPYASTPATEPEAPTSEATAPSAPEPSSPVAPPASPPVLASAPAAPPPLPRAASSPTSSVPAPTTPFSLCFVCGGPLDGKNCPTCRMTWVE